MQVDYSKYFRKQYGKLSPKARRQTDERISLWLADPAEPQLHDHALRGKYAGLRSINVSGDLRALYYKRGSTVIIFAFIGSHSQLY